MGRQVGRQVRMSTYIHLYNIIMTFVHPKTPDSDNTDDDASNDVGLGSLRWPRRR